jgi:hypothetical protein
MNKALVYYDLGNTPKKPTYQRSIYQVAINESGTRLYLGTQDELFFPTLTVLDLDPSGVPLDPSGVPIHRTSSGKARTQSWVWSPPDPANPNNGPDPNNPNFNNIDKLLFHYSPRALYRRHPRFADAVWPLYVWPLDPATGYPITPLPVRSTFSGRAEAVDSGTAAYTVWPAPAVHSDPAVDIVWAAIDEVFTDLSPLDGKIISSIDGKVTDGVTASAIIFTYTVNPTDKLVVAGVPGYQGPTSYLQVGVGALMAIAAYSHQAVFLTEPIAPGGNQVSDYYLRASISGPPPVASAAQGVHLIVTGKDEKGNDIQHELDDGFSVFLDKSNQQWRPTWSKPISFTGRCVSSRSLSPMGILCYERSSRKPLMFPTARFMPFRPLKTV